MNEGRFWAWRPWSQAQSGDVSLHPPCADTACKYTAWQMAWLCSSPPANLCQAGLMPERLADSLCLIHCHKRHIVYRTERQCSTNTNTPRVGDTLGKPLVCGSRRGLKENIAMRSLLQRVTLWIPCWLINFPYSIFLSPPAVWSSPAAPLISDSVWLLKFDPRHTSALNYDGNYIFSPSQIYLHASLKRTCSPGEVHLMRNLQLNHVCLSCFGQ